MSRSIVYVCEGCGNQLDTRCLDPDAARALARDTGWQTGATDYCSHDRADDDFTIRARRPTIEGDWDE